MPLPSLLTALAWGFTLWMFVDAARRRAGAHWLAITILHPLGGVLYFVLVKARSMEFFQSLGRQRSGPMGPPLRELHRRVAEEPTVERHVELGDALELRHRYDEAIPLYESILAAHPDALGAKHGLARCRAGKGDYEAALDLLEQVLAVDREYRDYAAALDYADVLSRAGRVADAVELLEGLVSVSGRPNHRAALAHHLCELDQHARARQVLEAGLRELESGSAAEQERYAAWGKRMERMLQQLS